MTFKCTNCSATKFQDDLTIRERICKKCGMISVNPYFTEAGVQVLYSDYLSERLLNVELENKRNEMYDIDIKHWGYTYHWWLFR